jgi:hypothetical protein
MTLSKSSAAVAFRHLEGAPRHLPRFSPRVLMRLWRFRNESKPINVTHLTAV